MDEQEKTYTLELNGDEAMLLVLAYLAAHQFPEMDMWAKYHLAHLIIDHEHCDSLREKLRTFSDEMTTDIHNKTKKA